MKFLFPCLMLVLAHLSFAQSEWVWIIFARAERTIHGIGLKDPALKMKAERLDESLLEYHPLHRQISEWSRITLASDYLSQLEQDDLVTSAYYQSTSGYNTNTDFYDKLGAALDDMYFKVKACLLNNGNAVGSVSVEVRTKKSGVEVSNWRVVCIAKILQLYPNFSPTAFPQLSSPTKWNLAPGNYVMWAEDPTTGTKSATQEIPVDRDEECDLAIP